MKDIAFGQYYPSNSIIHHLDPRGKVIIAFLYMIAVFFIVSYTAYVLLFTFVLILTFIAKIPLKTILKSMKSIIFISIFTAVLNIFFYTKGTVLAQWWKITITSQGLHFAAKLVLRIVFLVFGTSLLTLTTTPTEITDAIEYLLSPLKAIKFPVHDVALIMSISLRLIPGFVQDTDKIIKAQKARGASFDHGSIGKRLKAMIPILIPLFVTAFKKSDDIADALDARCYNATNKRTRYKKLTYTFKDFAAFLLVALIITFFFVDKYYFHNVDLLILKLFRGA